MFNIIEKYISNLNKDDVNRFALKKNINLSNDELDFTYIFIKKNYKEILKNPSLFNMERYKEKYSRENYLKISNLFREYYSKYHKFI